MLRCNPNLTCCEICELQERLIKQASRQTDKLTVLKYNEKYLQYRQYNTILASSLCAIINSNSRQWMMYIVFCITRQYKET